MKTTVKNPFAITICCLLSCLLQSLNSVSAQTTLEKKKAARVDRAVSKEMENQGIVGASIGIILDGKIVYTKGYGLADREKKVPCTSKTIINWASNSKPIVAMAAMQLVEEKKLKLTDKIGKYLPMLPGSVGDEVTVGDLLCHQSGYPHYTNGVIRPLNSFNISFDETNPLSALPRFGGTKLMRKPGLKYSYSSYGFVLASAVVQQAGKKPLLEQIEERILKPLEMKSFGIDTKYTGQSNWSQGYRKYANSVTKVGEHAHGWKHGAGGYKSNIEDFAKWGAALINKKMASPKSYKTLWTAQPLKDGTVTSAGLGFFVTQQNNTLKITHGGSHTEARSRLVLYPEMRHGIVVLCNCGHADPAKISTAIYSALSK